MLAVYVLILGIVLVLIGGIEAIAPLKTFLFWKEWVSRKTFFLHGTLLIAVGFPLTIYNGPLSTILFLFGLIAVLTGPFILIYPGKIRQMFQIMAAEINDSEIKKIIYAEALLRIAAGTICITSYLLQI
jgi:hypothetical protein